MESEQKSIDEKLSKLARDIELIKKMLIAQKDKNESEELELTDWAKNELKEARKTQKKDYISHEEAKRRILKK